jgi:hypothetical protein
MISHAKSFVAAIVVLFFVASQSRADCNPQDFAEITDIQQSPETELAFVLAANQGEYDRFKNLAVSTGTYGLLSKAITYQEALDRARAVAQATKFDYRSSYAATYLSQHIVPKAYLFCLEQDREMPGLRLWLNRREGDFLLFKALWVGNDTTLSSATYDSEPLVDGGTLVSKPSSWPKAQVQEIVVKRSGNADVFLNFRVGGQSKSLVVVKDPPNVIWRTSLVISRTLMKASSHGPNPGCSAGSVADCISTTRPGGSFVPGSRAITESVTSDPTRYSAKFTIDGPNQICVQMTQSTGACEVANTAQGRLMAIEKYPEVME